jgi:hypothetical protein
MRAIPWREAQNSLTMSLPRRNYSSFYFVERGLDMETNVGGDHVIEGALSATRGHYLDRRWDNRYKLTGVLASQNRIGVIARYLREYRFQVRVVLRLGTTLEF